MTELKDDIEKYLKGQLGPEEMHALEKKALSDPFLFDALGGAESIGANDFLAAVRELDQRVSGKRARRSPMVVWRIAASVALLVGASYVLFTFLSPKDTTLAQKTPQEDAVPPSVADSLLSTRQEKTKEKLSGLSREATSQPEGEAMDVKEEGNPSSEPAKPLTVVTEPAETQSASGVTAEQADDLAKAKADELVAVDSKEKTASAEQGPSDKKDFDSRQGIPSKAELSVASGHRAMQQVINGKVTNASDGSPIPGANVFVKGSSEGVISDVNGNYQLITNSPGNDLVVSFIGYQTKEVKIPSGESQVNVQLPVDVSALSEVVVAGYSKAEGEGAPGAVPVQLAEPVGGKRAYNTYLEKNLQYPQPALDQKIEGGVTIQFTVQSDGTLANFAVVRGLDASCNEEVIRLVKAGPPWSPSSRENVPINSTVRVQVKFKLPK